MPFSYHPPTRSYCPICEDLGKTKQEPVIHNSNGKASSAGNFPFHNWYYFVLGYSPEFPDYLIKRDSITHDHFVVDPFNGTGTTLIECKLNDIVSSGIEANDYFVDVARTKLNWGLNAPQLRTIYLEIKKSLLDHLETIDFSEENSIQKPLFNDQAQVSFLEYDKLHRPEMLSERYISKKPFVKLAAIKSVLERQKLDDDAFSFFQLAMSSIINPISNVRYGPGFGVGKPKDDVDVIKVFSTKVERMLADLEIVTTNQIKTKASVIHGDARLIDQYYLPNSVDFMITSPPYPGDHEYTKHTRLELIFMEYAQDLKQFRTIKERMIRGSTTNIYKEDNDRKFVDKFKSIQILTEIIDSRLKEDNATSGFEKLYTKLIWEYFGGMYRVFQNAYTVLKPGGKFSLLVSDSHAFKMVHIDTANLLAELAIDIGYSDTIIQLWQDKTSTSHDYHIPENILTLIK